MEDNHGWVWTGGADGRWHRWEEGSQLEDWDPGDRLEEFGMEYAIRTGHVRMEAVA